MALNRPFGLAVYNHKQTAPLNMRVTKYRIPAADGSAFYVGDTVIQAAGADTNGVPNVQKGVSASRIRGVIVGIEMPATGLASLQGTTLNDNVVSVPASKGGVDYYVWVCDDRDATYIVQDDGITTANLVAASASLNALLTIAAGATVYSFSGTVLLSSSFAVTAGHAWKLLGLAQMPAIPGGGSNAFGAYAVWVAKSNLHEFDGSVVGI